MSAGDNNQALAAFNKAAAMQPLSPAPQLRLADAHLAMKNKDMAAPEPAAGAGNQAGSELEAQRGLIALALDAKNSDEGLKIARSMQKQNREGTRGYQFEGDIQGGQKITTLPQRPTGPALRR